MCMHGVQQVQGMQVQGGVQQQQPRASPRAAGGAPGAPGGLLAGGGRRRGLLRLLGSSPDQPQQGRWCIAHSRLYVSPPWPL
jgi:hypothetical protein